METMQTVTIDDRTKHIEELLDVVRYELSHAIDPVGSIPLRQWLYNHGDPALAFLRTLINAVEALTEQWNEVENDWDIEEV